MRTITAEEMATYEAKLCIIAKNFEETIDRAKEKYYEVLPLYKTIEESEALGHLVASYYNIIKKRYPITWDNVEDFVVWCAHHGADKPFLYVTRKNYYSCYSPENCYLETEETKAVRDKEKEEWKRQKEEREKKKKEKEQEQGED